MENKKKIGRVGEIAWIIGNILCALGTCLVSKCGFGVSAIVAPAFTVQKRLVQINEIFTVGVTEYIVQGLLLALCCVLIGKFKPKFFATICNILFYGACYDIWSKILGGGVVVDNIISRIMLAIIGTIITGLAVALMLRTYIPPAAYDIFAKEVALAKKISITKMKLIFDTSLLLLGLIFMFTLLDSVDLAIIGPLTVLSAFAHAPIIAFFG